jgi:uncharacterized protein YjbJ (UPF0337 family)
MAASDKIKNTATQASGRAKEAAGAVTGNDNLKFKGQREQFTSNINQAGENLKQAAQKLRDALPF